jgi:hypothetical protein
MKVWFKGRGKAVQGLVICWWEGGGYMSPKLGKLFVLDYRMRVEMQRVNSYEI